MFALLFYEGAFRVQGCLGEDASAATKQFLECLREIATFVISGTVQGNITQAQTAHCAASFPWQGSWVDVQAGDADTAARHMRRMHCEGIEDAASAASPVADASGI